MEERISKVIAKLELHPLNDNSRRALDEAFRDARRLIDICFRYLSGVLPARLSENGYPRLTLKDIRIIKSAVKESQIHLPSDTVLETINRIYTNFRTTGETFGSKPRKINPLIPIRITKVTENRRKYRRSLTIEEMGSGCGTVLAARISLGDRILKRIAKCFLTGQEREPFNTIKLALKGEGIYLGDPSILVEKAGRYFLHLSITRKPEEPKQAKRALGVDLGISGPLVAMFAIEFEGDIYRFIKSGRIDSADFRRMWFGLLQRRADRMSLTMRGRGGATKRERYAEITALGESLHSERSKQLVYYAVNRVLEMAKELGCGVIVVENLRSFHSLLRGMRRRARLLGKRYSQCLKRGMPEEAGKLLRDKRALEGRVKLLQAMPWGRFIEDLKIEAWWRGLSVDLVRASWTSTTCPRCGKRSKESRRTRGEFRCVECGFVMQADLVGAVNVALAHVCRRIKKGRSEIKLEGLAEVNAARTGGTVTAPCP